MIEHADGLILRTRLFTESSLVVEWLTAQFGRLDTVAKGARRPKSPLRGRLDLFFEATFTFARSRRSQLHTLREVGVTELHEHLRRELGLLQQASYAAALIEQCTERDTPLPGIHQLMRGFVRSLAGKPAEPGAVAAFELKLLNELGLEPDLDQSRLSPGARRIAATMSIQDWPGLTRLKPSPAQVRELEQFLGGFLVYHLGRVPASRPAAWRDQKRI